MGKNYGWLDAKPRYGNIERQEYDITGAGITLDVTTGKGSLAADATETPAQNYGTTNSTRSRFHAISFRIGSGSHHFSGPSRMPLSRDYDGPTSIAFKMKRGGHISLSLKSLSAAQIKHFQNQISLPLHSEPREQTIINKRLLEEVHKTLCISYREAMEFQTGNAIISELPNSRATRGH